MSKKSKGRKVDLTEFLSGQSAELDRLPKGPSGRPREERRDHRGGGGGGRFDDSFGGGGRDDFEAGFGASEESEWRRAPASGSGGPFGARGAEDRGFDEGFRGDNREEPFSAADNDDQWRRGPRTGMGDARGGVGGFQSPADEDDQWRRAPIAGRSDATPLPSAADESDDWRGSKIVRNVAPAISPADEEDDWRGKRIVTDTATSVRPDPLADDDWRKNSTPIQAVPPVSGMKDPLDNGDWRKNVPVAGTADTVDKNPVEGSDDWRKAGKPTETPAGNVPATEDDGRPRLVLKKKAATDGETPSTEAPVPSTETATTQKLSSTEKKGSAPAVNTKSSDKWDSIFSKKVEERSHRMFGDQERDQERERIFHDNSVRNEPRERPGSHAFGGGRRNLRDDDDESAGIAPGPPTRVFPGSSTRPGNAPRVFPGSQNRDREQQRERDLDRERAAMAFGGGRQRTDERNADRERAAMVFGGGRQRGDDPDRERAAMAFGGGRQRDEQRNLDHERASMVFGGGRRDRGRGDVDEERFGGASRSSGQNDFSMGRQNVDLSKLGNVGDWGDEVDKSEAPKKKEPVAPKKLSPEELLAKSQEILKAFLLLENKRDAVANVKKLNSPEYMPELVRMILVAPFKDGGIKECKLVVSLLKELVNSDVITSENLGEGISLVAKKLIAQKENGKDVEEKTSMFQNIVSLLEENSMLESLELDEATSKIAQPNKTGDAENDASIDKDKIEEIVSSTKRGSELANLVEKSDVHPSFGAVLVSKLLQQKPQLVEDENCSWLNKDQYGELLAKVLFEDEPEGEALQAQLDALFAIQKAFHAVGFPRASDGVALIEKNFMKVYNDDIIAQEAIIAWKDDLSERPGKMDAIVQLSQFVNWLEEDDEDEEEDDEE